MKKPDDHARHGAFAILLLYAFFAALWGAGLLLGIRGGVGRTMVWGLPLWFAVSCAAAYAVVSVALVWVVRRYFR